METTKEKIVITTFSLVEIPLNRSNKLRANRKYENTIINRIIVLTMSE
jgi:hypothetical protein